MRRLSDDPAIQPNPETFPCGCVITCYEDDEAEFPYNKTAELMACSPTCPLVSGSLQMADDRGVHAEVREERR